MCVCACMRACVRACTCMSGSCCSPYLIHWLKECELICLCGDWCVCTCVCLLYFPTLCMLKCVIICVLNLVW